MITSKQRSYLKGLAHELDPVVYIGKSDVTENVINEIDTLLEHRELIKVKMQESCSLDPKTTANEIAEDLFSTESPKTIRLLFFQGDSK